MPYNLSKDYKKLFLEICKGECIVAYVDYKFTTDRDHVCRDICTVEKKDDWYIDIGARGICYGHVYDYMKKDNGSEEDIFIRACETLNLEWIPIS